MERIMDKTIEAEGTNMKRTVYVDNAATTRVDPRVVEKMLPFFTEYYANPNSVHSPGQQVRGFVEQARAQIASCIGARPDEIYFTAGGTESDNWVIKELAQRALQKGRTPRIITSAFEHHAVLHAIENSGAAVTLLPVYEDGLVRASDLEAAIDGDTVLVTVMFANNEVDTIQPISELAAVAARHCVPFHTDAVQAVGHIPIDVHALDIGLMSFSAHKFKGPKGVGALYVKKGLALPGFIHGGAQERNRRAGTENTPGIIGMAEALRLSVEEMDRTGARLVKMRDRLIDGLLKIPHVRLNGDRIRRLPGNVNVSIPYIEGESLLLWLDIAGICASSGSACTSGSLDPSHVLLAMGLTHEIAHGSLRMTLGAENTEQDVDYILETLPPIVEKLRAMSPLWNGQEPK